MKRYIELLFLQVFKNIMIGFPSLTIVKVKVKIVHPSALCSNLSMIVATFSRANIFIF